MIHQQDFYPRSPCGERPSSVNVSASGSTFLSTLSLRRATQKLVKTDTGEHLISIHALLAESDLRKRNTPSHNPNFYPRSPCGERRVPSSTVIVILRISIHALLAESDLGRAAVVCRMWNFYPRSPCGERRRFRAIQHPQIDISIHALLAESDSKSAQNSGALLRI